MKTTRSRFFLPLFVLLIPVTIAAQPQSDQPAGAEDVVRDIYRLVTFSPEKPPDWEKVKEQFFPSANVFLRVARDSCRVFSVQGFIDDFIAFANQPRVQQNGFSEKVIKAKAVEFGNIAHVLVLYEAHIPGSPRPPQQGVDSWQLIKERNSWKILSVVNELPTSGRPLPDILRD